MGAQISLELINSVINSNDAFFSIDLDGNVLAWNEFSENLFCLKKEEVMGKFFPLVKSKLSFELETIISTVKEGKAIRFKTQKINNDGRELTLVFDVKPLVNEGLIIGASIVAYDLNSLNNVNYLTVDNNNENKEHKRTFNVLRDIILISIGESKKTINQISHDSGVNWRTVEKHLTYLIGKKLAAEIFSSEYVRIFELTHQGLDYVNQLKKENFERNTV